MKHLLFAATLMFSHLAAAAEAQTPQYSGAPASGLLSRLYPDHAPFLSPSESEPAPTTATLIIDHLTSPTASALSAAVPVLPPMFADAPAVPLEKLDTPPPTLSPLAIGSLTRDLLVSPTAMLLRKPIADYKTAKFPENMPDAVKINHAGLAELMQKLSIDARRARFIMEFRQAYGPFKTLEDLTQVYGISDAMLDAWEQRNLVILD